MKQLILLLFCLAALCSCKDKDEQKPEEQNPEAAKKSISEFKTDPISIAKTSKLISYFLKGDPRLERIARQKELGGYFYAREFTLPAGANMHAGVVLWHCYNPQVEKPFPEFFLAVEQVTAYDSIHPPQEPQKNVLTIPIRTFVYRERDNEERTIMDYIDRHITADASLPAPITIGKEEVKKYATNFSELMRWIEPYPNNPYCKYPHAFFRNNSSYKNFMRRSPAYVRYYLGLAYDDDHYPNYLRPILAPVNASGGTIMEKRSAADEPFIQKSVPPPPYN
jgi:hypothetical protein